MRLKNVLFLAAVSLLTMASPVFAQEGGAGGGVTGSVTAVGAAVGMAIASGLCGLGQGKAVASAAEAVARNPGAAATIQTLMVLGLAFIESLALFTLVIIFLKA
jgi:F-type H+-transporting ATPase subunit c